jgi:VWFA-related protein
VQRVVHSVLIVLTLLLLATVEVAAQAAAKPSPSPTPTASPTPIETDPDSVRVFTEEVRLPVTAVDAYGHYDPTLVADDVLIIEDGVIQEVRSVRHIPANVLFILDTGGEGVGLGGISKSTSLTRDVALDLIKKLPAGSWFEIMQSGNSAEIIQPWTRDKTGIQKLLNFKLYATKRSRIADTIVAATQQLKDRPEGSRHVVMITDGVDSPGSRTSRAEAIQKLIAARATVHIISYTDYVRQKPPKPSASSQVKQVPPSRDPITATDPTLPPGMTRQPAFGIGIRFDPAMKKQRKAYEAEIKRSQQALTNIANETGGKLILPKTREEMLEQSNDVVRAIGAEYVVTYRPKRPLAEARQGEYRKVEVQSRRVGITLHARRGYVVPTKDND